MALAHDVALFTSAGLQAANGDIVLAHPPLSIEVPLGFGVTIAPVREEVADYVINLCDPHAFKTEPVRQFRVLYGFISDDDTDRTGYRWDSEEKIATAIALSRLAHATSIGFEYSARLIMTADTKDIAEALPGPNKGFGAEAYVVDTARDWLTERDVRETRELMAAYYAAHLDVNSRVGRALWFHEYAARTFHLDIRWVLVATGLEALVNTGDQRSLQQYRTRTLALAEATNAPWTDHDAKESYRLRSKLSHGLSVSNPGEPHRSLYARMESVLRLALRRAILDQEFRAILGSNETLDAAWPLPAPTA